jgi:hypothetical protein
MRTFLSYYFVITGLFLLSFSAAGQKVTVVEPDQGVNVNALKDAILANGDGIYELRRNGIYFLDSQLQYDYEITIRAQEGSGDMPIIQTTVDNNAVSPEQIFRNGKSLTLEGIYITGKVDGGAYLTRIVRTSGTNITLRFKNCYFDAAEQTIVRCDAAGMKIYFDGCIIRNIATATDPNNGRIVDGRGNAQDSVVIRNSTIYGLTAALIRYDNAPFNYIQMDHNTFYNIGYSIDLGTAYKGDVTNNIFANVAWRSNNSSAPNPPDGIIVIKDMNETDEYKNADRRFNVKNNNIYLDKSIDDLFITYGSLNAKRPLVSNKVKEYIENGRLDSLNLINELLSFNNAPALPMQYIAKYFEIGEDSQSDNPYAFFTFEDPVNPGPVADDIAYKFRYSSNSKSATLADGGAQLGDPRWKLIGGAGIDRPKSSVVNLYSNPVGSFAEFSFSEIQVARIKIADLNGRVLKNVNVAGTNSATINVADLSSGVYIYTVYSNSNTPVVSGKLLKK